MRYKHGLEFTLPLVGYDLQRKQEQFYYRILYNYIQIMLHITSLLCCVHLLQLFYCFTFFFVFYC